MCQVSKDCMDDLEPHEMLNSDAVQEMLRKARTRGIFPGWNIDKDGELKPRKKEETIMSEDGKKLNGSACDAAATVLGFHLQPNALWLLPFFDPYYQVKSIMFLIISDRFFAFNY